MLIIPMEISRRSYSKLDSTGNRLIDASRGEGILTLGTGILRASVVASAAYLGSLSAVWPIIQKMTPIAPNGLTKGSTGIWKFRDDALENLCETTLVKAKLRNGECLGGITRMDEFDEISQKYLTNLVHVPLTRNIPKMSHLTQYWGRRPTYLARRRGWNACQHRNTRRISWTNNFRNSSSYTLVRTSHTYQENRKRAPGPNVRKW